MGYITQAGIEKIKRDDDERKKMLARLNSSGDTTHKSAAAGFALARNQGLQQRRLALQNSGALQAGDMAAMREMSPASRAIVAAPLMERARKVVAMEKQPSAIGTSKQSGMQVGMTVPDNYGQFTGDDKMTALQQRGYRAANRLGFTMMRDNSVDGDRGLRFTNLGANSFNAEMRSPRMVAGEGYATTKEGAFSHTASASRTNMPLGRGATANVPVGTGQRVLSRLQGRKSRNSPLVGYVKQLRTDNTEARNQKNAQQQELLAMKQQQAQRDQKNKDRDFEFNQQKYASDRYKDRYGNVFTHGDLVQQYNASAPEGMPFANFAYQQTGNVLGQLEPDTLTVDNLVELYTEGRMSQDEINSMLSRGKDKQRTAELWSSFIERMKQ